MTLKNRDGNLVITAYRAECVYAQIAGVKAVAHEDVCWGPRVFYLHVIAGFFAKSIMFWLWWSNNSLNSHPLVIACLSLCNKTQKQAEDHCIGLKTGLRVDTTPWRANASSGLRQWISRLAIRKTKQTDGCWMVTNINSGITLTVTRP